MKSLKDILEASILDIEGTMKEGDAIVKAEKEFKKIVKNILNFNDYTIHQNISTAKFSILSKYKRIKISNDLKSVLKTDKEFLEVGITFSQGENYTDRWGNHSWTIEIALKNNDARPINWSPFNNCKYFVIKIKDSITDEKKIFKKFVIPEVFDTFEKFINGVSLGGYAEYDEGKKIH
jgi:hypothetical protein